MLFNQRAVIPGKQITVLWDEHRQPSDIRKFDREAVDLAVGPDERSQICSLAVRKHVCRSRPSEGDSRATSAPKLKRRRGR